MTKRFLAILLCLIMVIGAVGCGQKQNEEYTEFISVVEDDNADAQVDKENSQQQAVTSKPVTNQKPTSGSSTAVDTTGKKVNLANPIYVADGKTAMDKGLNFGGKTFLMAVRSDNVYQTGSFKRLVAAFEKKFNCKILQKTVAFEEYQMLISNAKASGKPYDILFCHGSMFPQIPLAGIVNDLSPYITSADYDTGKGGIDIEKSSYFAMDKNLYGVVGGEDAVHPVVIYYNKLMFSKAGLEDPMELYKAGKWTWSKFQQQGKKVTTGDVYYGDYYGFGNVGTVHSMGVPTLTWKDNKVVLNLDDPNVVKGYQLIYSLFNTSKICAQNFQEQTQYKSFAEGKFYVTKEETQKYGQFCEYAANSAAFNRDAKNLGIVPIPQDSAAKKRGYPCGWYTAVMSGAGSTDPRVAVAFAKFWSTYEDPVKDEYELPAEYEALRKELVSGNIVNCHGSHTNSTGDQSHHLLTWPLSMDVALGKDVASTIASVKPQINACIDYVMNKK